MPETGEARYRHTSFLPKNWVIFPNGLKHLAGHARRIMDFTRLIEENS
jgi:hypothetical protein